VADCLDKINAGKHFLLIPRTDDCIAILLGSYQAYRREMDREPGTYYLSNGQLVLDRLSAPTKTFAVICARNKPPALAGYRSPFDDQRRGNQFVFFFSLAVRVLEAEAGSNSRREKHVR